MNPAVLIVDDEVHIRLLIEQTLEDLEESGIELLTASNGAEALDIVKNRQPDLIFLDVMMPRINGFDVCKIIKHDLKLENVCIVMLTAKGQAFDKQKGIEVGADWYITKPFDPDELYERTVTLLGREID